MNTELAREVALQVRKDEGAHWFQGGWWSPAAGLDPDAVFEGSEIVTPDGSVYRSIRMEASQLLGLTWAQMRWLFDTARNMDEVLWALENDDPAWAPEDYREGGEQA